MISQRCASSPPSSSPALGLAVASCGGADPGADGRLTVVATTTQAADLTRAVAGDRADVVQLLQPNSDPHDYEAAPERRQGARARRPRRPLGRRARPLARRRDRRAPAPTRRSSTLIDHVRTRRRRRRPRSALVAGPAQRDAAPSRRSRPRWRGGPGGARALRARTRPRYTERLARARPRRRPLHRARSRRRSASSSPPTTRSATTRAATA